MMAKWRENGGRMKCKHWGVFFKAKPKENFNMDRNLFCSLFELWNFRKEKVLFLKSYFTAKIWISGKENRKPAGRSEWKSSHVVTVIRQVLLQLPFDKVIHWNPVASFLFSLAPQPSRLNYVPCSQCQRLQNALCFWLTELINKYKY